VIRTVDVVKRWGSTTALSGASVVVAPGVTGLLGANGAGKTTLLGMLLGLHKPDEGRVEVLGLDPVTAGPAVRARVGYSPEHHLLPPDVRAYDLVRHVAEIHGLPHQEANGRASDALFQVGLGEERFRPIGTMSTGQRQRVKLAQAIAHDPVLILLDEPTDGLDPVQRDSMLSLIRRIGTDFGINVLLSSHLLDEVERVCDSAVILHDGMVAASGSLAELRGTGEGLVLELDADPVQQSRVVDVLRASGAEVRDDESRLLVTGSDDLFDVVRDAVVDAGAGIRRLQPRTVSLEDVFLGVEVSANAQMTAEPLPQELGSPG
jgi:ABC-2 type transport system ATP-binding protein